MNSVILKGKQEKEKGNISEVKQKETQNINTLGHLI